MTWHTLFAGHDGQTTYHPDQPLGAHPDCLVQISSEVDPSVRARLIDRPFRRKGH